jgi:hypothetical protein
MFKRLSIDGMQTLSDDMAGGMDTGAGMLGGPMFDEQPRPDPQQGQAPQSPEQPMQLGAPPPMDPSAPPVGQGAGLPQVSDLNPQAVIGYRKLNIRRG